MVKIRGGLNGKSDPPPDATKKGEPSGYNRLLVSFEARFGKLIAQNGVAAIPAAVYLYQGKLNLTAQEVWFVSYILAHKWDGDLPHPRLNEMARQTGTVKQILHRYKNRLCDSGYLSIQQRYKDNGGQDANAYDFSGLFARLEYLIMQDPPSDNDIRQDDDEEADDSGSDPVKTVPDQEPASVPGDMSFYARYGRVILGKGIAAVPMAVFTCQKQLDLTPQQVWFVSYIFSFKWTAALPHPSINKMSARTGYSKVQLHEIKSSLVDAGYLSLVHRYRKSGGQTNNAYDFSGLFESIRKELQGSEPKTQPLSTSPAGDNSPPVLRMRRGQAAARIRSGNMVEKQRTPGNSELTAPGNAQFIPSGNSELTPLGNQHLTPPGNRRLTETINRRLPTRVNGTLPPSVTAGLHKIEAEGEEQIKRDDSNRFSPYIAAIATDFSSELGDAEHSVSNVSQTLRIWQQSGLEDQQFVEVMYEARKRTRQYIGKLDNKTTNRMPYYFKVLRDLAQEPR